MSTPKMIKFKTRAGVRLRTFSETISPLLVEGTVDFNNEEVRARGSSQIAYCDGRFFGCEEDTIEYIYNWPTESYSIGISFETLHSCLSAVSPNDIVTILITEENQNNARPSVTIIIENVDLGYSYEDSIYLLLLETQELDDGNKTKQFDKLVSMSSSLLLRVLRNAAKRSDSVQIYTRKTSDGGERIYFRSNGDDASLLFSLEFDNKPGEEIKECLKKDVYSLKFLLLITKSTNLSNAVGLYLGDQQYLAINYKIGVKSNVLFCLAPQVDRADACPRGRLEKTKVEKKTAAAVFKRPVKRRKKRVAPKIVGDKEEKKEEEKEEAEPP